jgi:hypothetical protein
MEGAGNDFFGLEVTIVNILNDKGIAIWTQVRSVYVQLFAVADDGPVERGGLTKHTEFYECSQPADHIHALGDT